MDSINLILKNKYKIEKEIPFSLKKNPYSCLSNNKINVTEYQIGDKTLYVDDNNIVYQLIEHSFTPNLAESVGYLEKKTIYIYNPRKKN